MTYYRSIKHFIAKTNILHLFLSFHRDCYICLFLILSYGSLEKIDRKQKKSFFFYQLNCLYIYWINMLVLFKVIIRRRFSQSIYHNQFAEMQINENVFFLFRSTLWSFLCYFFLARVKFYLCNRKWCNVTMTMSTTNAVYLSDIT